MSAASKAAGILARIEMKSGPKAASAIPYVYRRFGAGSPLRQMLAYPANLATSRSVSAWAFEATVQTMVFLELAGGNVFIGRMDCCASATAWNPPREWRIPNLDSKGILLVEENDLAAVAITLNQCYGSLLLREYEDPLLLCTLGGRRVCFPYARFEEAEALTIGEMLQFDPVGMNGYLSLLLSEQSLSPDGIAASPCTEFRDGLNQEALSLCAESRLLDCVLYNYLAGGDSPVRSRRIDAIRSFPLFAPAICDWGSTSLNPARIAIDCGAPLIDAFALGMETTREIIRYLGKVRPADFDACGAYSSKAFLELGEKLCHPQLVRFMRRIPPEHRPGTTEDWPAFLKLRKGLNWLDAIDADCSFEIMKKVARQGWAATAKKIAAKYGSVDAVADCGAYAEALRRAIEKGLKERFDVPTIEDHDDPTIIEKVNQYLAGKGLWQLLEKSGLWHRRFRSEVTARLAELERTSEDTSLDFPVREPMTFGELRIVPLLSALALVDEGERMGHCVATRYSACRLHGVRLFSVRTPSGESLSTFELEFAAISTWEVRITVNEHRGPHNGDASKECIAAAASFVELLFENAYDWNLQNILAHAMEARILGDLDSKETAYSAVLTEAKIAALVNVLSDGVIEGLIDAVHEVAQ